MNDNRLNKSARVTNLIQRTEVDGETGEMKQFEEEKTINYGSEPNFIKVYLNDLLYISDLPKGLNSVLYALLKRMSYGNQIVINASLKRQIGKEINRSVSTINNAITMFVKGKLLFRIDTGLYEVNSHIFGKGEWKDIAKIRMNVTFEPEGKTIMTEIENSDNTKEVLERLIK